MVGVAVVSAVMLMATGCSKGRTTNTAATPNLIQVFVQQFRYHGMPATLSAGYHQIVFKNNESFPITHEMIPIALPAGKTAADIAADAKAKGPDSEDDWLHIAGDFGSVDTGASIVETMYLPPGNYAIACWQTGKANGGENGPTHVSIGMYASFTVT
ncbi:MAG TPA: hypothetical protein VGH10_13505 [Actinomycetota bacterium]|jgi:hypothetical protein